MTEQAERKLTSYRVLQLKAPGTYQDLEVLEAPSAPAAIKAAAENARKASREVGGSTLFAVPESSWTGRTITVQVQETLTLGDPGEPPTAVVPENPEATGDGA